MSARRRPRPLAAGIDYGGTWLRIVSLDADGHTLRRDRLPAPPFEQFPDVLKNLFRRRRWRPASLSVASRGVWTAVERRDLARRLSGLAKRILIMSDAEAAFHGAFGAPQRTRSTRPAAGILIVAGTGSMAYGRDERGRVWRAGGLGPLIGDEGSAFWIGREWARRHQRRLRGWDARRVAGLARRVFSQARRGDAQ
ncbi:MAG TPA: BadF/BadG/BcrA/BcrD ATPase family protein, partial [Elusimicrobiota bacterium]|nr:BadF/BadG/BcrA/BcrD ATPase family protein [Elusimicrobiota bacterium]